MLQAFSREFSYLQRIADLVIVIVTWIALYFVRFHFFGGSEGPSLIFFKALFLLLLLSAFFFAHEGLYESQRLASRYQEISRVFRANVKAILAFIVLLYLITNTHLSRTVIVGYSFFSTLFIISFRLLVRSYLRRLRHRGRNLRHCLLVGNGWILDEFVTSIRRSRDIGLSFAGWLDSAGSAERFGIRSENGTLEEWRERLRPDLIVVSYLGADAGKVQPLLRDHFNSVVPILVLPDLSYSFVGYQVDFVAGIPAISLNQPDISDLDMILKRIFDLAFASFGLLLLSPLLFLISLLIKLTSPGPIFFSQERIGLDERKFKMWKFRSMKKGAETSATWTVENDPRRTKIGSFLRRTNLDELPQLWNVFRGEMSLVGPRPEQPQYVNKFKNEITAYMLRHKMKVGMTGWAQVNGWRGDTSLHERINCDLYYIKNWSFWLDLKILFLTVWRAFSTGY